MKIPLPSGEVYDSSLEEWQIAFLYYMADHSGLGVTTDLNRLLMSEPNASLFNGGPARCWREAWERSAQIYQQRGYDQCLHELLD